MITSTTSATSATSGSSALGTTATPTDAATDPAAAQDRFLKLLVAQLNNQDPMNPMDNAQMTSQIAQINTVTGIQQLNDTVAGLVNQFSAQQMLQGSAMVVARCWHKATPCPWTARAARPPAPSTSPDQPPA
jgi:Flagellar hook capping protein